MKVFVSWIGLLLLAKAVFAAEPAGHHAAVPVAAETRIDWTFALANQSLRAVPPEWGADYDATSQKYELYVPRRMKAGKPSGLILFISPGGQPLGLDRVQKLCDESQMLFASPHQAGNDVPFPQRVRIVLDVLDDLRRKFSIDADRTYVGGFSGGGRVACAIAFALPEFFGGVIPVCAAGDLREESWLRQRVIDRISVAHLTGDADFNRGEVELFRGPLLAQVGVRSRVWVAPKTGHALPAASWFEQAVKWLDGGQEGRRKFARNSPASRVDPDFAPSRETSAKLLFQEGKLRLEQEKTLFTGLMQLKGVHDRWPDLPEAGQAKVILLEYQDQPNPKWEEDDIAEQRRFLLARAKSLSAYAESDLPEQYRAQRGDMLAAAIDLWTQVIDDGSDESAVKEGRRRVQELRDRLGKEK